MCSLSQISALEYLSCGLWWSVWPVVPVGADFGGFLTIEQAARPRPYPESSPRGGIEETAHAEPISQARRPSGERLVGLRQPHAMRTAFVDVQLGRHTRFAQRRIEHDAVLHGHGGVGGGVEEEGGRRPRGHLGF